MSERSRAISVLVANTLAFTACFAVWVMYGVLITYLADLRVVEFSRSQIGWLIGIPILTGSVMRLPAGMLADRFGGRPVFAALMLLSAGFAWLVSLAGTFTQFLLCGLGFGLAGASFAVGVGYTSQWFPQQRQGTALGIFGIGNTGAALTSLMAPGLLMDVTGAGEAVERWRLLPQAYALMLLAATVLFWLLTFPMKPADAGRSLRQRLAPLGSMRVWRFGLYYFLLFGGFVSLSQWLVPYYLSAYSLTIVTAGVLAALFSLPSGLFRAIGGWLADRMGARTVLYGVFSGCAAVSLLLIVPRMDIETPGEGVMAVRAGTVTEVRDDAVIVDGVEHALRPEARAVRHAALPSVETREPQAERTLVWPQSASWHEPVVRPGDVVGKRQLLARGVTHIFFQANLGVFVGLVMLLGIFMGVGMGAVFKHIPTYFPRNVGAVGGMVGVIGGLGGFATPILYGYMLDLTGIWTTSWMFLFVLALTCLLLMHGVVRRMMRARTPDLASHIEERHDSLPLTLDVLCPVHRVNAQLRVLVPFEAGAAGVTECSLFAAGAELSCGAPCVHVHDRAETRISQATREP
jgi:NNP family nitrate/nitrite transporter-like MFS transporter